MCDNLGISDEKVNVYKFTYEGSTVINEHKEDVIEMIKSELDSLSIGDTVEFKIEMATMTRSQLEALPEFDGF